MPATRSYRLPLALAAIGPIVFWIANESGDWAFDWRWGLVVPVVITGYVLLEARGRRSPQTRQYFVLTALILVFWVVIFVSSLVAADETVPSPNDVFVGGGGATLPPGYGQVDEFPPGTTVTP
jgi:hypothetical protein